MLSCFSLDSQAKRRGPRATTSEPATCGRRGSIFEEAARICLPCRCCCPLDDSVTFSSIGLQGACHVLPICVIAPLCTVACARVVCDSGGRGPRPRL